MVQLPSTKVVDPFGEVNVYPQGNKTRVTATILMTPAIEGASTGLAIDGSASMQKLFGSRAISKLFAASGTNLVEPVAKTLADFLANFDSQARTKVIYWACGAGGGQVEEKGDFSAANAEKFSFGPPVNFGTGTRLVPALRYFTQKQFPSSAWSIFVFITDGVLDDFDEVKSYTLQLAREIAAGKRGFLKLVLIGIGEAIDEAQLDALDNLDYQGICDSEGYAIDLWDHKLASEMQKIEEIFAEVVTRDVIVAPSAQILDDKRRPVSPIGVQSYNDGLPAFLEFSVPSGTQSFELVLPDGTRVTQPLS